MVHYDSDYQVRKAILAAVGGDATKHYHSVYDIDIAILEAIKGGGGGGVDWDTIKEKLSADGVDAIKFTGKGTAKAKVLRYLQSTNALFDPKCEFTPNTTIFMNVQRIAGNPSVITSNDGKMDVYYTSRRVGAFSNYGIINFELLGSKLIVDTNQNITTPIYATVTNGFLDVVGQSASGTPMEFDPFPIYFGSTKSTDTLWITNFNIYEGEVAREYVPAELEGEIGFVDKSTKKFYPAPNFISGEYTGEEVEVLSGDASEVLDYETLKTLIEGGGGGGGLEPPFAAEVDPSGYAVMGIFAEDGNHAAFMYDGFGMASVDVQTPTGDGASLSASNGLFLLQNGAQGFVTVESINQWNQIGDVNAALEAIIGG